MPCGLKQAERTLRKVKGDQGEMRLPHIVRKTRTLGKCFIIHRNTTAAGDRTLRPFILPSASAGGKRPVPAPVQAGAISRNAGFLRMWRIAPIPKPQVAWGRPSAPRATCTSSLRGPISQSCS